MCGVCDNDSSNDCIQDCNDQWGGTLILDNCGNCIIPGWAVGCLDCMGEPNGDAVGTLNRYSGELEINNLSVKDDLEFTLNMGCERKEKMFQMPETC